MCGQLSELKAQKLVPSTKGKGETMHRVIAVAAAFAALLVLAGAALAAHNGNNRAELAGAGGITGVAIVNYSEGQGDFNGNVSASGLMPNTSYSFYVAGAGAGTAGVLICSGTSDAAGVFTCSAQHKPLPGFSRAEIRLGTTTTVVAMGTFERRGNCRDPEQGGSQCVAPGQNK